MKAIPLTDRLSVSGQLEAADFPALAAAGVRRVINNRPDGEAPGQLTAAAAAGHAAACGLEYIHIPVAFPAVRAEDVDAFRDAVLSADGPVHAHCRSGTRSANLWFIGEVLAGDMTRAEVGAAGARSGIGVTDALSWLDRHAAAPDAR
ncbi:TIGR01244 family sulfur transferase [Acidisphaera rubrifaciens]|uniref:Metallo-beta-lactamase n=1 Tax=Acidisphaera rubrifaciens HS-AP3 TaxID=1231350 RepID=A0A0D6P6Z7_9PROT|nr:TIGR01244 family sulfur transferase [Acidisphaera rubrifaciens]GAN76983.1 metallo-beta-lactamase [Acidisphaera rubrifaciens HS-AP3]